MSLQASLSFRRWPLVTGLVVFGQSPLFQARLFSSSFRRLRNAEPNSQYLDERLMAATKRTIVSLQNNDFPALRASFPWFLRFFLSEKRVRNIWKSITYSTGEIESFSQPDIDTHSSSPESKKPGVSKTNTLVTFQRCNLGLQLRFNKQATSLLSMKFEAPISLGLTPPWKAPPYITEGSYTNDFITLKPDLLWPSMKGTLTIPTSPGPHPVVLLIPGSGAADLDLSVGAIQPFKDLAFALASNGIAVLRLPKPTLKCAFKLFVTRNITLEDECIDPNIAGLKYLAKHPSIDPDRVFVCGISLGGRLIPRMGLRAKQNGLKLTGLISLAGASRPLAEISRYQLTWMQTHFPRNNTVEYQRDLHIIDKLVALISNPNFKPRWWTHNPTSVMPTPLPLTYLGDDADPRLDPVMLAKGLDTPMLFMQGSEDWQVRPKEEFEEGFKAGLAGKENVEFKLYEGLNHCFIKSQGKDKGMKDYDTPGHVEEEVVKDLVDWIKKRGG